MPTSSLLVRATLQRILAIFTYIFISSSFSFYNSYASCDLLMFMRHCSSHHMLK